MPVAACEVRCARASRSWSRDGCRRTPFREPDRTAPRPGRQAPHRCFAVFRQVPPRETNARPPASVASPLRPRARPRRSPQRNRGSSVPLQRAWSVKARSSTLCPRRRDGLRNLPELLDVLTRSRRGRAAPSRARWRPKNRKASLAIKPLLSASDDRLGPARGPTTSCSSASQETERDPSQAHTLGRAGGRLGGAASVSRRCTRSRPASTSRFQIVGHEQSAGGDDAGVHVRDPRQSSAQQALGADGEQAVPRPRP